MAPTKVAQNNKDVPLQDRPRPHVCSVCLRGFMRLEHLKRHERSHTQERPFSCEVCKRSFARRDLLLRHQQKIHAYPGPTSRNKKKKAVSASDDATTVEDKKVSTVVSPSNSSANTHSAAPTTPITPNTAVDTITEPFNEHVSEYSLAQQEQVMQHPSPVYSQPPSLSSPSPQPSSPLSTSTLLTSPTHYDFEHQDFDYTSIEIPQEFPEFSEMKLNMDFNTFFDGQTINPADLFSPYESAYMPTSSPCEPYIHSQARDLMLTSRASLGIDMSSILFELAKLGVTEFSGSSMSAYFASYTKHFYPYFPFVHLATYEANNMPLLLAQCAIGAVYANQLADASKLSQQVNILLPMTNATDLEYLQTLVLQIFCAIYLGQEDIQDLWLHLSQLIRLHNFKQDSSVWDVVPFEQKEEPWRDWTRCQERRRTFWSIFILTSILSITDNLPPLFTNPSFFDVPLPCSENLWHAKTFVDWSAESPFAPQEQAKFENALSALFQSDSPRDSSKHGMFHYIILLCGIHNHISHYRINHFSPVVLTHVEQAILSLRTALKSDLHSMQHSDFLPLLVSVESLLHYANIRASIDLGNAKSAFMRQSCYAIDLTKPATYALECIKAVDNGASRLAEKKQFRMKLEALVVIQHWLVTQQSIAVTANDSYNLDQITNKMIQDLCSYKTVRQITNVDDQMNTFSRVRNINEGLSNYLRQFMYNFGS